MALIREAATLIEQTGMHNDTAEGLRVEGELLLATGDPSGAETKFRAACAAATRQGAALFQRRAEERLVALESAGRGPPRAKRGGRVRRREPAPQDGLARL